MPKTNPITGFDTLVNDLDTLLNEIGTLKVADLLPLPAQAGAVPEGGGSSLCRLSADLTKLQVHVHNQGTATAPPSTVHVEFANNPGGVDIPTPELVRGGSAVLEVAPPASCWDASNNCHFSIGVDSTNAVAESDEVNNNAAGVCGPSIL